MIMSLDTTQIFCQISYKNTSLSHCLLSVPLLMIHYYRKLYKRVEQVLLYGVLTGRGSCWINHVELAEFAFVTPLIFNCTIASMLVLRCV